jgi:hypothetical protein
MDVLSPGSPDLAAPTGKRPPRRFHVWFGN